ncbi:dnaJ homolog subfamily C member 30, mitochondrial-like [Coccinella septempunctata]|uniref:dnaJ homolog subfamily C member 30, mitochondrial-like n=1 Tax=Coccinella septempunctata TaxID=41139 RepID=UPI001D080B66|nr:dnaJ homolog subfamily C member 30, mitochondrial-like [Coccinella septempunctata]
MCSKVCRQSVRTISIFRSLRTRDFYESLELKPGATQADIKEAYYRLSMKYHPDRNKGEEASVRFRQITEAYEVLRNVKLRKLYDKGLTMNDTPRTAQEEEINKFYKSRQFRSRPPPPTGRTPIYDFDEWSRSHYGATLARDIARKKRRQQEEVLRASDAEHLKKEKILICTLILAGLAFYFYARQEGYDKVKEDIIGKRR